VEIPYDKKRKNHMMLRCPSGAVAVGRFLLTWGLN
jgi:hypothetical protein